MRVRRKWRLRLLWRREIMFVSYRPLTQWCAECDCGRKVVCSYTDGFKRCRCENNDTDELSSCQKCDCGPNGTCYFVNSEKRCSCDRGHIEVSGICKECDCGEKGLCSLTNGRKICECEEGYGEKGGICRLEWECLCGEREICSFEKGVKKCECEEGYIKTDGVCRAPVTTTTTELSIKVTTQRTCDCGKEAHSCGFDLKGRLVCVCYPGYDQVNYKCEKIVN
ncbi:hypothetical protein CEXT_666751 [Caerostris extrusa]|uniref:EGF-like domain-containing protein n=1 Tax=Caerostris extrusa TaxID=172846 RepID=A0AAV4RAM6_CAEEX|nr:hypothetical protein CEXT_666751 [Caerostris extrusa]